MVSPWIVHAVHEQCGAPLGAVHEHNQHSVPILQRFRTTGRNNIDDGDGGASFSTSSLTFPHRQAGKCEQINTILRDGDSI